ncbi:MAG: alpha/beta hydrolase [Gammaproteobacteria bacterium]|nr:alpha/beta hydrolase [Gammaproteobacteria bacterium]
MYPTITEAVADRLALHLGSVVRLATPLLLTQLRLRLGIGVGELRPADHLRSLNAPLLLVAGAADRHTTLPEARRPFDAAVVPKDLWVEEGAAHVDLHAFAPGEYERRVGTFLGRYLSQQ